MTSTIQVVLLWDSYNNAIKTPKTFSMALTLGEY